MSVKARVVILAAGTLESTRLLLNSKIANSSGVMGHYLIDQVYGPGIVCSVPEARDGKATPGMVGGSALVPRFRNIETRHPKFLRGYALNIFSNSGGMDPRNFPTYGEDLQNKLDSYHGSGFQTSMMGEVLARHENQVSIDPTVKDAWDIPALHIQTSYTDNEIDMARDAVDTSIAMAEAAGFEILAKNYNPNPPGYSIHELGTCRMGDDPKTSVLNKWNQSHDIKNLLVVDAACFTSHPEKSVTLTIMALALRASEHLAEEIRLGNT
jgi:choline dehydrogenase-like flavoprotein